MCELKCEKCVHITHYGGCVCKGCESFTEDKALLKAARIHGIKAYYENGIKGAFAKMERDGLGMDYLQGQMVELCGIVLELAMGES